MDKELKQRIETEIAKNDVTVFMKGEKDMPMCGFSARVAQVFKHLGVDFNGVNVLQDDELREGIKEFSQWPTIPQVYVRGEFIGGCDITIEMFQNGELQEMLGAEAKSA